MKNCLVSPKKLCCQISTKKNFFDFGTGKYLGRVNILNLDKKWLFYLLKSNGKSNNYSWGGRFGFLIACRDILKLISRFDRSLNLLSDAELHSVDQKSMDPDELVIGSDIPIDWVSFVWVGPVGMDQGMSQDGSVSVEILCLDWPVLGWQIPDWPEKIHAGTIFIGCVYVSFSLGESLLSGPSKLTQSIWYQLSNVDHFELYYPRIPV